MYSDPSSHVLHFAVCRLYKLTSLHQHDLFTGCKVNYDTIEERVIRVPDE